MKCYIFVLVFAISIKLNACDEVKKFAYDLSTHILDTGKGRPAAEVPVTLYKLINGDDWTLIGKGQTETDGRYGNFASNTEDFTAGTYKLHFDIKKYYGDMNEKTMFPIIDIIFNVDNPKEHYHIPILLNAFGYTTYRGS